MGDVRMNALWGGNRGTEQPPDGKTRVLRALALCALGVCAAAVPALAADTPSAPATPAALPSKTYVSPSLLSLAASEPTKSVRVIVRSEAGVRGAVRALAPYGLTYEELPIIGGVTVALPAGHLQTLAGMPGLTVTADAVVSLDARGERKHNRKEEADRKRRERDKNDEDEREHRAKHREKQTKRERDQDQGGRERKQAEQSEAPLASSQLWAHVTGLAAFWASEYENTPTIALVDSGIEADRPDYDGRVLAEVNLASLRPNSPGDGRGHGTFVAGVAAGAATGHVGAAPRAKLVSIDVMNDEGKALTSDVIAGAQWIYDNKARYGIRVANFSLHARSRGSFTRDPLDAAVEMLWLSGVVVVTAAGNEGKPGLERVIDYAPANDPFVITVGAMDLKGTAGSDDDEPAPWSAFGRTRDGFAKPEVSAPGRHIVGPIPPSSTLARERASKLVGRNYIRLSGTSFAAPVVAGAAALLLSAHPAWTPDQVKGALMLTARPVARLGAGVGQIDMKRAMAVQNPPNPNAALNRFVATLPGTSIQAFDAASWDSAARLDASWDSASWSDASWDSASWSVVSWSDASWESASWESASWESASWSDVSWSDAAAD